MGYLTFTDKQIEKYLERIGYQGTVTLTKETLDQIIYAHQCTVPFENLDVYDFHKTIYLDAEHLFEKLVLNHRGGYCFETNGLFFGMINSMGFDAYPCLCRVMFGVEEPKDHEIDHRASIVTVDGKKCFCEAGIGGAMPPGALEIGEDHWQLMHGEEFCTRTIEPGWYGTIRRLKPEHDIYDDWRHLRERLEIMFSMTPVHEVDYANLNFALSQSPDSMFRQRRVVNLRTKNGYRALTDEVYREVIDGKRTERKLALEEIPALLKEKFALDIREPLRF